MNLGKLYAIFTACFVLGGLAKGTEEHTRLSFSVFAIACLLMAMQQLVVGKTLPWLFAPISGERTFWRMFLWWEKRRLAYNLVLGLVEFTSLILSSVFSMQVRHYGHCLLPYEPAVPSSWIFVAPLILNVLYCLGPLLELAVEDVSKAPIYGPILLKIWFSVSMCIVTLPVVQWLFVWLWSLIDKHPAY